MTDLLRMIQLLQRFQRKLNALGRHVSLFVQGLTLIAKGDTYYHKVDPDTEVRFFLHRTSLYWMLSINEGGFPSVCIRFRWYIVPVWFYCAVRIYGHVRRIVFGRLLGSRE